MKITRQLRLNALAAEGTAPIQLTIAWEGNRLGHDAARALGREAPLGEGAARHAVRRTTNPHLNRVTEAAFNAQAASIRSGFLELCGRVHSALAVEV